jgi:hypothetical protein
MHPYFRCPQWVKDIIFFWLLPIFMLWAIDEPHALRLAAAIGRLFTNP